MGENDETLNSPAPPLGDGEGALLQLHTPEKELAPELLQTPEMHNGGEEAGVSPWKELGVA